MSLKRKDKDNLQGSPTKTKKIRPEKKGDFSDDDLSDIEDGGEVFNGIRIPAELPPIVSAEEKQGPRMVIQKIVANNFKSYYGEVTVGPFHKSLTSIVGANGSGKSNVIDSLLFVFGYRSTKIRSKKVSVLLHKSDKHKDVNQCSVTVHFVLIRDDDTQGIGFVAIPGSEISITRTAFKDNSSYYTLNNKRVKFKEVATILKKNGIDLIHNRFLILQGEVEQIAMMKPKAENDHSTGMLEYLEDVIGTARYKKPIYKLEEKVKDLSLEKNEKITRLKFVAKERDELIEPVEAVIRYLKLENQAAKLRSKMYQKEIFDTNKVIETKTEKQKEIKEKICFMDNELKVIAENKKEKDKALKVLQEKHKAETKKLFAFEKKSKTLLLEEDELKTLREQTTTKIKKCENSIKQEQKKITKARNVPKTKEAECEVLKSQLAPLEKECIKLEENYSKINSSGYEKSKKFREEKDAIAPEVSELQKIVGIKQNQFKTLKTQFDVLLDTEKSEREKLINLEEQLTNGTNDYEESVRKKQKAEEDVSISKNTIKELEKNIEKLKSDEQQIKSNLQNIRMSLSEKRTAYAETTERSRPIQYILSLKDKGKMRGLLGRCGDYGQVEGKYDVPASTACGSTDQIVVETSDVAHECIQQLRTNNIGRLTFSILPQVQKLKPRADAINKYPEDAKRIFDFIQILDQRFRLTFYSGLYDTLLAENLEQARRVAFGTNTRYRVVTFKGDLIDQSGIMSGGGRPIKGKIGPQETKSKYAGGNTSQVTHNEVERLDKTAKELEVKLKDTQSNIYDLQNNVEQHRRKIEELNILIRGCLSCINSWEEKKNQVKSLIEAQKLVIVKKKADPVAVAKKETEINEAEKELEKATKDYEKIKSKMDNLTEKIKEITEVEPREAKCLLDEATSKLENVHSSINQVNVDIQAAERQLKKSESEIETLNNEIDELQKKKQVIEEKQHKNKNSFDEVCKQVLEMNKIIKESNNNIDEIKNKDDENLQKVDDFRKQKITLSQELNKIESEIENHVDHLSHNEATLSKLKLHTIPQIDSAQRDPYLESYQTQETKNSKQTLDKNNEEVPSKIIIKSKENEQNQMEVDNADDIENADNLENANNVDNIDELEEDDSDGQFSKYTDEQLESINKKDINLRLTIIKENLDKENPNFGILDEYHKRTKQYHEKADEVAVVLKLYNEHNDMINKVRQRRRDEFMASFKKITIKLKEMYQMITLGGDAELELVDSLDPFSEGVNFSVRPPKKTWKVISNLSGGEKTLSSLALVFALHYYKPSPLYVMDEIDAALDFKNVSIIAYYIKERTKNSQFIIISLRSNMFEKANLLVGIYKTNDCTQTISIVTSDYEKLLKGPLVHSGKSVKPVS